MGRARQTVVLAMIAAAWVGTAAAAPLAHAKPRTPSYFAATTTASAFHVSFTQAPADSIITGSLVNDDAGYATSGFTSGGSSEAEAAPLDPGTLVVGGPGLLCTDLFTCPFSPPEYPLLADASFPRQRDAHVASSKPTVGLGSVLRVNPSYATAHADLDGNSSTTRTGQLSLLDSTPFGLSFGASSSSSHVTTHGSTMKVQVSAAVSDIKIGPLLRIGSVRTTDRLVLVRGRKPVDHPDVTLSGVTVAGKSATITEKGILVDGHSLGSALATKLVKSGVKVRSLGVARTDHAHSARSSAGGVEVDFALPVKNAPYIPNPLSGLPGLDQVPGVDLKGTYLGVVQLGGAGAVGSVHRQPGVGKLPSPTTTGRSSHHPSSTGGIAGVSGGSGAVKNPPRDPSPVVTTGPHTTPASYFAGLSRVDLLTLYLVIALGTAGIFIGWRGTVSYRRRTTAGGRGR